MRKLLMAAIAATAITFGAGVAAAQDWQGLYGGVVIGGQVGAEQEVETVGTAAFRTLTPTIAPNQLKPKADGAIYGVVGGYTFASAGGLIWGIEGDLVDGGDDNTASFSGAPIPGLAPAGITTSARKDAGLRGTLRGRLGVAVGERAMIYGTGGLAVGRVKTSASVVANGAPTVAWTGEKKETLTGWTLGAGAEFKATDRIILRGEYLYTDLGDQTVTAAGNTTVRSVAALNGIDYVAKADYRGGELRAGLVFKF
jgi:outer membrane immunogenic protein